MSQNPKRRSGDTKKTSEKNLREAEPPVGKQDPTEPVEVKTNRGKKENTANDPHVAL